MAASRAPTVVPDARHQGRRRRHKTWRAYLSTQAVGGATAVNAKDRIGKGPWTNAKGVVIATSVEDLHSANNKITARDRTSPRPAA